MRPDVKYGVVISAVVVLIAGGYFLFRDKGEAPIPVAGGQQAPADAVAARTPAQTPAASNARPAARPARKDVAVADSPTSAARRDGTAVKRTPPVRSTPPGTSTPASPGAPTTTPPRPETPATQPGRMADAARTDVPAASPNAIKPGAAAPEITPPAPSRVVENPPAQPPEVRTMTPTSAVEPERVASREEPERPVPLAAIRPPVRAETPAASGEPVVAVDTHRAQPGDTLSSLSQAYYGSTRYAQFLKESNPDISDPDRLAVGTLVRIPQRPEGRPPEASKLAAAEKASADKPAADKSAASRPEGEKAGVPAKPTAQEPGARRTYTVKAGDSFYSIAKDVLGDAARWKELFELNKAAVHGDATRLRIGQVVILPDK